MVFIIDPLDSLRMEDCLEARNRRNAIDKKEAEPLLDCLFLACQLFLV
jgi:hypothetical protein